mmetsp:Transcript_24652/g.33815  ORF Transcript_24652/g.33815 Transcript_24652/m.33815 type:complete len:587 (+) Transcript_24652:964-2724(+)
MGMAQQTKTVYWHAPDMSNPFVSWILDVANDRNPPLSHTICWGSVEQANSPFILDGFNTEALKLAIRGVTILAASGDHGVAYATQDKCECGRDSSSSSSSWRGEGGWQGQGYFPLFPATSPYVTVVGATMGPNDNLPEVACQSQTGGVITTGGGFSTYFKQPDWQRDAVNSYLSASPPAAGGYNRNGRAYPDVSLIGTSYITAIGGSFYLLHGTSCSTPVFAAFVSLANAARSAQGLGPVGFLNPTLYSRTRPVKYKDMTVGSNKCCAYVKNDYWNAQCCNAGFAATTGWDPVTGWGSIDYPSFYDAFMPIHPTPAPQPQPTNEPTTLINSVLPSFRPSTSPQSTKPSCIPTTMPSSLYPSSDPTKSSTTPSLAPTVSPSQLPSSQLPISCCPTAAPSVFKSTKPSPKSTFLLTKPPQSDPTFPTPRLTSLPILIRPTPTPLSTPLPIESSLTRTQPVTIHPTSTRSIRYPSSFPPSRSPTAYPTLLVLPPSVRPSYTSSFTPTPFPSVIPTLRITKYPNNPPSKRPISNNPSFRPTHKPITLSLSKRPTCRPTVHSMSILPSRRPTTSLFKKPSRRPTTIPSIVK